jgi:hypothetical protein
MSFAIQTMTSARVAKTFAGSFGGESLTWRNWRAYSETWGLT